MTRTTLTYEERMDRRTELRTIRDEAAFDRRMALEDRADELVGQLCREGRTTYYACLDFRTGRIVERDTKQAVIDYLIRNKYVS